MAGTPAIGDGASLALGAETRQEQPIILIRGFGGLSVEDEKKIAYQGFNDGTVYPHKRGENYIYEGMILKFMKSRWSYFDATNVIGYHGQKVELPEDMIPEELTKLSMPHDWFSGHKIVIDPGMALRLTATLTDPSKSIWVFRYYDLDNREQFREYAEALKRLIDFIRILAGRNGRTPKVNIIAHSMGGLIAREAIQSVYQKGEAELCINKVVTLGTPHQGIAFQVVERWIGLSAGAELERFNPEKQADRTNAYSYLNFSKHFPPERLLTVVGTNYRTYGPVAASWLNRAFSVAGEFGANYNRSDGLVKQHNAMLPGAPRTFVHKCHGGSDSLVTSREAFEIATRFLFGNVHVRLNLMKAEVTRGFDFIGKSEFFFGVSIKPRGVDFDLFHQSAEAENCYGPFADAQFRDPEPAFGWAGSDRLIWEGWLDTTSRFTPVPRARTTTAPDTTPSDLVMRLDVYVGERDLFGFGFSDNVVFRKQYYIRAVFRDDSNTLIERFELHAREDFSQPLGDTYLTAQGWRFTVSGTGFNAEMLLSFATVPETGPPVPVEFDASPPAVAVATPAAFEPARPGEVPTRTEPDGGGVMGWLRRQFG
ncbi:hypothetical protein [uncultured Methylobacterium sp.]|jgi:pimeloyl-ACP methyl ester carboxylesterase|uniref:PGAP1-like alpha/beta domain-containing protein n=1 Tax=uncultured Methylobacterium sp. TaxID=157278 RepID=UPI00262616EB|nr:hypothetical protein [uncultured Methylobacterium sp.]